jgi:signal transduction histidine kinase
MRWPLRIQVLVAMAGLMLGALLAVSLFNAFWSAKRAQARIEHELRDVAETLGDSSFPLTDDVLKKMRGLSGADFVLIDQQGSIVATSIELHDVAGLPAAKSPTESQSLELGQPIVVQQARYFHAALSLRPQQFRGRATTLHILYPEKNYQSAWWDAVYPPLIVGTLGMILVVLVGLWTASRVTRPLRQLQSQVNEIARGNFRLLPVPSRNDEISDLSRSINQMSHTLAHYEDQVRRNERLRTLGQLGGGIAHQMRNSATGCRIAVQLHARDCPLGEDCDSLDVAQRQLQLMERYLQRFLSLGTRDETPLADIDLGLVVSNVVSLVRPTAEHMGVQLQCMPADSPCIVAGDQDALEQLLVNLLLNAVEASTQGESASAPTVGVAWRRDGDQVLLDVTDSGEGPCRDVQVNLFDPFVSAKRDGTGLGLAVARETAEAHGGEIHWQRREGQTCFVVSLPAVASAPLATCGS